ncbi:predicted N-ribosylNicotinamide CRP-like regulator [Lachnospiraceae bacterium KM106-2]|nr:predicted N-ribosylNicotinamide CRP-like regulator [Lachnospiraceae bacterium KM106-2]
MKQDEVIQMLQLPLSVRKQAVLLTFAKGDYLCKTGKQMEYLMFLLSGEVKVSTTMANGKVLMRCFTYAGGVIGDIELMTNGSVGNNVVAVKETVCFAIPFSVCKKELLGNIVFMNFIARQLGKKFETSSKLSAMNQLYTLENRLCAYIANSEENGIFSENLTELAELLGISYRHLLRTLYELCEKKVLEKKSRTQYAIHDSGRLEELAKDCFME